MSRRQHGLVAVGALALGVWLGVSVGLATRAKPHRIL
jgi:hypothetical protein